MDRFHAHVYFDPDQQDQALVLRSKIQGLFAVHVGTVFSKPVGPHPKGMFQVLFDRSVFADVLVWLMQNRAGLDILVHGDSGNDLIDHTRHVMWLGQSRLLNLGAL